MAQALAVARAFAALPVAALITSIVKNSGKTYEVVSTSKYYSSDDIPDPQTTA